MPRGALAAAAAALVCGAAALAFVAWVTREGPPRAGGEPPGLAAAPPPLPPGERPAPSPELPADPVERERVVAAREARALFDGYRRGFEGGGRSRAAEARLLPALDALFPRGAPRTALECRRLLCRLEVDAPAAAWRARLAADREVRRHAERIAFDPDGDRLAFVQLVELRVADGPRPEGERVLEELAGALAGFEPARRCVRDAPGGAEVHLTIDESGVTYRFGAAVGGPVAHCLMTEAMPEVLALAAVPPGVRRAERAVRIPPP